jgi:hypothetical protein
VILAEQPGVAGVLAARDLLQDDRFGEERIVLDFHRSVHLMASGAIDSGHDDSQAPGQDDSKPWAPAKTFSTD